MLDADLLLVPSRKESYSIVTAEAIACALPVVSNRTGAVARFGASPNVRYVDATDVDELRASLRELMIDPAAYARLCRPSPVRVRAWDRVAREFLDWFGVPR